MHHVTMVGQVLCITLPWWGQLCASCYHAGASCVHHIIMVGPAVYIMLLLWCQLCTVHHVTMVVPSFYHGGAICVNYRLKQTGESRELELIGCGFILFYCVCVRVWPCMINNKQTKLFKISNWKIANIANNPL